MCGFMYLYFYIHLVYLTDVYFLLVGKSKSTFSNLTVDLNNDFFISNIIDVESFAADLAKRICKSKK